MTTKLGKRISGFRKRWPVVYSRRLRAKIDDGTPPKADPTGLPSEAQDHTAVTNRDASRTGGKCIGAPGRDLSDLNQSSASRDAGKPVNDHTSTSAARIDQRKRSLSPLRRRQPDGHCTDKGMPDTTQLARLGQSTQPAESMPRQARSRSRTRIVKRSRAHIGTEPVKSFRDMNWASRDLRRGIFAYSAGGSSQGAARAVIHRASRSGCIVLLQYY